MTMQSTVSRRQFLKSGAVAGGGFFVATAMSFDPASAEAGSFRPSVYIEIRSDGQIILTLGKSEMGQGTLTGLAQLVADELDCAWSAIEVVQAEASPAFGFPHNGFMITGGSSGLRTEWMRMRKMGAAARMMLMQAAAEKWRVNVSVLTVSKGTISDPRGRRATFGELASRAARQSVPKDPPVKPAAARTIIGTPRKRVDTQAKITGKAVYGVDVEVPNMVTAVVIRPPQLEAGVETFDAREALARPGVEAVFPITSGLAVVGDHYWAVHLARELVQITWKQSSFAGMDMDALRTGYAAAMDEPGKIAEETGDPTLLPDVGGTTLQVEQPYLAHACMEPMNMTVSIGDGRAEVWGPTQAQTFVQATVAKLAGIAPKDVTVHTTFLGGGFGRRSAQDFVRDATEIALATRKPVKLIYSREDDMRAGRYRPFSLARAAAVQDRNGNIAALDVKVAVPSVSTWSGLKFLIRPDGIDEQAVEGLVNLPYDIPNRRVAWVEHDPKVPVHFWRAVGSSHNPFLIECLIDDLAKNAGKDPLSYRRTILHKQPRYLGVLDRLEAESRWSEPVASGVGRGMAIVKSFDTIVGEVADVRLDDDALVVDKVTCVVDCGVAVNPGQIEAQMHSSIVYGLSAFLRGEITFADGAVEQSNFHDYEPLRMPEMPKIDVHILEGGDKPGGVGEPGLPPILPALANALFALTGKRISRLPYVA